MTPGVNCLLGQLPAAIPAYVISNSDGTFTIMLNSRHSRERNLISYRHELFHILNGDYDKKLSADYIEIFSHAK